MSRWFTWLTRIGGSCAVTRWSWILTAPFAVTVMGSYISARSPYDWPADFRVAVVVHLVMGVALLFAWLTVLRPGRARSSPSTALAVFALLGAARPFLLDALLTAYGVPVDSRHLEVRVLINVVAAVVVLSFIAVLVDTVREHAAVMRRLRSARAILGEQRRADEEYLTGLARRCADDLAGRIDTALAGTDRAAIDSARGARLLRGISEDIVRPMSHALFDDATPLPPPIVDVPRVTRRERWRAVVASVRPAPLALPVLLYMAVILVFLLTSYGVRETVLQVTAGTTVCVFGNWVVQRVATRIGDAGRRIAVMVTGYCVIAAATAVLFWLILGGIGFPPVFVVPGVAFYPFAAIATCLIAASTEQRAREEQHLAEALSEQSRVAAEVHAQVIAARRRLAHVLHSSVQGELVAAALAMRAAPDADATTVTALIERVLRDVARDEPRPSAPDARQQITELIEMWSVAVPVAADIDDAVWPLLSASPVRLENAVDVLSEGFTNAIRHGVDGMLHLQMIVDPRTSLICIGIRSPGQVARDRGAGLGLATLAERVGSAELVEEPGSVLLSVRLR